MNAEEPDDVWRTVVPALDPLERRALTMIYRDGLTQRQIADRLQTRPSAVAVAVARAMRVVAAYVEFRDAAFISPAEVADNLRPSGTAYEATMMRRQDPFWGLLECDE